MEPKWESESEELQFYRKFYEFLQDIDAINDILDDLLNEDDLNLWAELEGIVDIIKTCRGEKDPYYSAMAYFMERDG